jgi:hypothetical protein
MKTTLGRKPDIRVCKDEGRLLIEVPWKHADRLQDHFRALGMRTTLHLDPGNHEARLEPWTNLSPQRLVQMLESWAS